MKHDTTSLIRQMEEDGWTVRKSRNSHYVCRAPDGVTIQVIPSTPSDWRSSRNALAAYKRWANR